ncbi:ABC transporter permease [Sphingobacterium lactis]|uniref:ABC transporter permease n=1 Tax=Sphingobacterium lactis TaxID=797291 RepID=UPI003F7F2266
MFNLKIAWRSIKKNKFFSSLNILGLSISLGIALLLIGYSFYELSFDKMYKHSDDIYRVTMKTSPEYNDEYWPQLPNSVGPAIQQEVPGVIRNARMVRDDFGANASIQVGEKNFVEKGIYLADSSLFSMFDFQFVEGDKASVFKEPKSIVISQSKREKIFGTGPAINQLIYLNQRDTLRVTGVYEDLATNSSLDCEMVYNIMDSWMGKNVYWSNASYETYIQLDATTHADQVANLATALIDKNVKKEDQYFVQFQLQPNTKVHLHSAHLREGISSKAGDFKTVKNLLYLAGLILLIACINYMNLATARTTNYAKEVGVNKVLGASKGQVRLRFFTETFLISTISIGLGLVISILVVPFFNQLTGANLTWTYLFNPLVLLTVLLVWFAITLISGSFPAFYLSSISSLNLMGKGKGKNSGLVEPARKGLVVFQFTSSIILIISVIIMIQQVKFIEGKDIGYEPQQLLSISNKSIKSEANYTALVNAIQQLPATVSTTAVQTIPGANESGKRIAKFNAPDAEGMPVYTNTVDGPICKTLGLHLLAGSDLPKTLSPTDTVNYILINEVAQAYLGYKNPEDAIGQLVRTESAKNTIIKGVVRDFNYSSLKEKVGGYYYSRMNRASENTRNLLIRYEGNQQKAYLDQVETAFKKHIPDVAFDYTFVDSYVDKLYETERRTNQIIIGFSVLAIGIACLGLMGLAAFTAEQRSKEIGIRKVLGASVFNISKMLSGSYVILVIIAFFIAVPIAYYLMNEWLSNFVYRIEIHWWVFAIAAAITLIITVLTISFQTIKAAIANPVDSLKDE